MDYGTAIDETVHKGMEPGLTDTYTVGDVKVDLANIGEGLVGEYDENDPDDVNLLRFYVSEYIDGEWYDVDDASYCTNLPASITQAQRVKALRFLMERVYPLVIDQRSIKKVCEQLSHISEDWLE